MYDGSMYGKGLHVFGVWNWVIANAFDSRIEINSQKLSHVLGCQPEEIEAALEILTAEDPKSRHKIEDGKRLIQTGEFEYFIPTWEIYQKIRNRDDRREYNRIKQAEYRAKKKGKEAAPTSDAIKGQWIPKPLQS